MSYATLLVQLEIGQSNAGMLGIAADLARRFGASVVGIVACQPMRIEGDGYVSGEIIQQDRNDIDREVDAAEGEFREALTGHVETLGWRSTVTAKPLSDYVAHEARCADLILVSAGAGVQVDPTRRLDLGALVMQAARPVLVVPADAVAAPLRRVVVGWNDTREIRRAVGDAMPMLQQASEVTLVSIVAAELVADARARLSDVVAWLARHGVRADAVTATSDGADAAGLEAFAQERRADAIVAGAYGHSRLREWALGGVTRDLLLKPGRCSFLSH